ncbi:hypothetical protein [Nonomuraea lactucae]|uniref:hypothetical protein n=1 Tax=Nonomuraea lactucae TaxID=2249762 RepID=UPI000DE1DB69|nr:hypothetical protein [Nonomuraea lactucae]
MTPEEATWVRTNVLARGGAAHLSIMCRCTNPPLCHYCSGGGTPPIHGVGDGIEVIAESHLLRRRSGNPVTVGSGWKWRTIDVWLADRVCRNVCPCRCHTETDWLPAGTQAALFDLSV